MTRLPVGALAEPPKISPVATAPTPRVDWAALLTGATKGKTVLQCAASHTIFMQGHPADAVYFLTRGKVQLAVTSQEGKEAIVATLGAAEFFGEGCLAGQPFRLATATSAGACTVTRVERSTMARMLQEERTLASIFMTHLLSRIVRYEAD